MKSPLRILIFLSTALVFGACRRPTEENAGPAAGPAADPAATEAIEAERARLQAEREALEAERAALAAQREAGLAAREQEADLREIELSEREGAALDRESDLSVREQDLALREQNLSEQELAAAGTTVIDDWTPEEPSAYQEPVADYDLFYDDLSPHGSWFDTPDYGYIFQPAIVVQDNSWRPYTRGRWICTNLGWTWYSDEPFGWACFHYGRWVLISGRGWCWVPGSQWAPSWCAWRSGGGYVGWAPLPPETLVSGGSGWGASVEVDFGIGDSWFCFVESRHIADPLWQHCLPQRRNVALLRETRGCTNIQYRNHRVIAGGPSYAELARRVNRPWPVCRLEFDPVQGLGAGRRAERARHGNLDADVLRVFAPNVETRWNAGLRPTRVAGNWEKVEVERAPGGVAETWQQRFRENRQRQQAEARALAQQRQDERAQAREETLKRNREAADQAKARYAEATAKRTEAIRQRQAQAQAQAQARANPGRGRLPKGVEPAEGDRDAVAETIRQRSGGQPQQEQRAPEVAVETAPQETAPMADRIAEARQRQRLNRQRQEPESATAEADPIPDRGRSQRGASPQAQTQAESNRARQEEARQAALEQARQRQEEARQRQEQRREAMEQSRQQQEDARRQQQELARQQQEMAREQAAERARQQQEEAARRAAEQQARREEQARQQQEAMQRAAEERARQQEEARQAAEERARQQEDARRAAQEQAQQRQEEMRRAAEERARQQEEARQAAQERARQQQEEAQQRRREQSEQEQQNRRR